MEAEALLAVAHKPLNCEDNPESLPRPRSLPWAEDDCELVSTVEPADRSLLELAWRSEPLLGIDPLA